jgi:hypothetical protein
MDLEEMKVAWKLVNENLAQQQAINKKLLRGMLKEQGSNRFSQILRMEMINQLMNWGLLIIFFINCPLDEWFLSSSMIFFTLIVLLTSYLSHQLVIRINKVDIQRDSFIQTLENMYDLKKYYYKYKKNNIIITIIVLVPAIILGIKILEVKMVAYDLEIPLENFILPCTLGGIAGAGIMYQMYRDVYEKNLEEVEELLQDLKEIDG